MRSGAVNSSSTDLADISWNVPTVSVTGATFVPGVPAHSWQATACAGGTIGVKGMMVAAKSMSLTTLDLFDPAHIESQSRVRRGAARVRLQDAARRRKPALDDRK
jgi:aminobenzoyl-glutamate utilization protein B